MGVLTLEEIRSWGALPPSEMKERVQRRFADDFRAIRASLPALASDHAIIVDMLRDPVWGEWGQIGSYQAACKVLGRYLPDWNKNTEPTKTVES